MSISVHVGSGGASGTGSTSGTGTEPGGEAASGTLDLPKPEEAEAVPVTEPVDARSVYILSGGAVSTGENGTTAGEGMQDGSVQLVLPEKAAQKTWPVYAALALSVLPFEARAASDAWDGTVDISWYDPAKTEYEIDTPAKLAGLAALVNGMADPTAKKIVGNTAYLVSKKVDNVMLVGVSGERSEAEFETGWQPAVRNLVLGSGWIYARRMVGGIVGRVGETSNGVVIENCGNRADIKNTDSKGVGGIVGSAWGKGTIRSCYNTGSVSTTYTCPAGGILGSNEGMDVYNCYSAGKIDTNGAQYGRGIGGHDTGSYTVAGCWYLSGSDDDPASNGYYMGTSRRITVDVTAADQKTLQSEAVLTALNTNGAVFAQDAAGKNEASVSSANTGARVSTGSIVGNAQNLIWGGCTAADSALPKLGRTGKVAEQEVKDVCPDYTPKDAPQDAALPDSFTVTFRANGETVGTVTGKKGDKTVKAPALPQLDGYTASWPAFTPTGRDMTITAVYRQNLVSGGAVTKSGTYFIPWLASGEIRIAGGLDVTLIGLDSGSGDFDNLTLTVEKGTKLTLQDVRITGDRTLLSLAGGNTLTLLGENRLTGCADASGNACPTIVCGGDLTICGSGSLALQALVNNAAFMGAETSKISIADCTICVFKSDKLGFDGGAFCASGAALTMTNASFFGRTDSDNVAVLSADTINMTGCTVRVESERSVHAVLGSVSLTNCGLYASGHSGNSAKTVSQTAGLDALETVSQQSGVTLLAASGFADIHTEAVCQQDVLFCTDARLMTGTGNGAFSPDTPMTRAMLVTLLWRTAGSPAAQGSGGFTDLMAVWYRQAAVWGAQNGVVAGTGAGTFSPDKAVTKEQAAALLVRFARIQGAAIPADAAPVYVAECSAWAQTDVQAAYAAGILDRYAACLAAPQQAASRAELARMLCLLSTLLQKA